MKDLIAYGLAAVLGLLALFGVIEGYSSYERGQKVQNAVVLLQQLKTELSKKYQYQTSRYGTAEITAANLIAFGAVPSSAVFSTTEVRNPWLGELTTTGSTSNLLVDFGSIDTASCISLTSELPAGIGILSVAVASSTAGLSGATPNTFPVPPATGATLCSSPSNALRFRL